MNYDLIDLTEPQILTPAEFVKFVKENNRDGKQEFIANPVCVVDCNGDEVSSLPGHWKVVEAFQSGKVMYRR